MTTYDDFVTKGQRPLFAFQAAAVNVSVHAGITVLLQGKTNIHIPFPSKHQKICDGLPGYSAISGFHLGRSVSKSWHFTCADDILILYRKAELGGCARLLLGTDTTTTRIHLIPIARKPADPSASTSEIHSRGKCLERLRPSV